MTAPLTPEEARETANAMDSSAATFKLYEQEVRHTLYGEDEVAEIAATLRTYADQAERLKEMEAAVSGLLSVIDESGGIQGWHRNGDIADWSEFEDVARLRALQEKK